VKEAVEHGLDTDYYAKQSMNVMHVSEVNYFSNRCSSEGIVDVVSLA
jgi:hypothetical protein